MYEKLVLITRKTRLAELIERFNTFGQAQFYIEHSGGDFSGYVEEDEAYKRSLETVRRQLEFGIPVQVLDRSLVPTFLFSEKDVVITLGQDGLVANCAKYVGNQPLFAVNPDPSRFDGVLLPFLPQEVKRGVHSVMNGSCQIQEVTLAKASLNDGQELLAFNDLFIGAQSHVSARYRIQLSDQSEPHSSSGIIVSTGAGSTGWLSSIFNMLAALGGSSDRVPMKWGDAFLTFVVREPFVSRHSKASLVTGQITPQQELVLESMMPTGGVIFSDGVEADYIPFNSGSIARINVAERKAQLVTKAKN